MQFRTGSGGATEPFVAVNPVTNATEAVATVYFVWNPTECFSLGFWANWEYNDNGTYQIGQDSHGNIRFAGGSRNIVTIGARPVYWISDNIAIQAAGGWSYINNDRGNSGTNAFGSRLRQRSSPKVDSSPGLKYACSERGLGGVVS